MADLDAPLGEELLDIPVGQTERQVPPHSHEITTGGSRKPANDDTDRPQPRDRPRFTRPPCHNDGPPAHRKTPFRIAQTAETLTTADQLPALTIRAYDPVGSRPQRYTS
jgi:hypothetical protein